MYTRGQTRFQPLRLRGNEKPRTAPIDRLCNAQGCNHYIDAGDQMIRWGSFDLHIECAIAWCEKNGVEYRYVE